MNHVYSKLIIVFFVVSIFFVCSGQLHADTILFDHSGSNDPTSEGWAHNVGPGGSTSSGPVINDLGLGTNAWYLEDTSVTLHTWETYSQTPSGVQVANASLYGWTLSTTLRMVSGTTGVHNSMFVDYIDGATQWSMAFDVAPDGDPIIDFGDPFFGTFFGSYTVEGGAGTYHTYSLQYDPVAGSADLFVDGIERISDYTGVSVATTRVSFGAGASNGTGRAHYNSVQFSVAPEPASLLLMAMGAVAFLGTFKRAT